MTESAPPLLEMRGIDKRFGALSANRGVELTLRRGEILGLLGENGAGKTTLMNILFGIYRADAGEIRMDDLGVQIRRPGDALKCGIGMVHQHFHLVERHTVLENLMVGEPGIRGWLDRERALDRMTEIASQYGLELDPDAIVGELSVGEQQRLEIVKALYRGARILILDEPTSVLSPQQTEGLFTALRAMSKDGVGIIFISHKLNEILAITHRLTVMRRGGVVANLDNDGSVGHRRLAELMCGRDLPTLRKPDVAPGRALIEISNLSVSGARGRPDALRKINLTVHATEIVGIAGVSGNGQGELADVISGVLEPSSGSLRIDGVPVGRPTPRSMQRLGVAHIPEDRIGAGLLTTLPLSDSMVLPRIQETIFSRAGWINRRAVLDFVAAQMKKFDIRAPDPGVRTGTLSGGNLQKVLLARELAFDPLVLVASQPTRGLDISAKDFVHRQFLDIRSKRRAVLVISEDLEELFAISDRILVMYEGEVVGDVRPANTSIAEVGLLMTGSKHAA